MRSAVLTWHQGMLVPIVGENDALDLNEVHWILVIEKEVGLILACDLGSH